MPTASAYPPDFVRAVEIVLTYEGGYVNNPDDPGLETNFGISKRNYPDLDIARLTVDDATAIYFRDWWTKFEYGRLPGAIAAKIFVLAVNMGNQHAVGLLQGALRACGQAIVEDGVLGQLTIDSAHTVEMGCKVITGASAAAASTPAERSVASGRVCELRSEKGVGDVRMEIKMPGLPTPLMAALRSEAAGYYRQIGNPQFLKGWLKRAYD
jgi:hypothetical protein